MKKLLIGLLLLAIPLTAYALPKVWRQSGNYTQTTGWVKLTGAASGTVAFLDKDGNRFRAQRVTLYAADDNFRICRFQFNSSFADTTYLDGGMDIWTGGFPLSTGQTFESEVGFDGFRWSTYSGLLDKNLYYEAVRN